MTPTDPFDLEPSDRESFDRDELVAAYLDGEASAAEVATVQADPDLLARAETLREVADMIAAPVMTPPAELRQQHIEAALAASATEPNVTALTTSRRRWSPEYTKVLAAAAAIVAVLLGGTALLSLAGGGDADDVASTDAASEGLDVFEADAGESADEALATTEGDGPAPQPTPGAQTDEGASADTAMAESVEAPMEAASGEDLDAEEEAAVVEEMAEKTADDSLAETADERTGSVAAVTIPVGLTPEGVTTDAFAAEVRALIDEPTLPQGPPGLLACEPELDQMSRGLVDPVLAGAGRLAGTPVEFVVIDELGTLRLVVVAEDTCTIVAETELF